MKLLSLKRIQNILRCPYCSTQCFYDPLFNFTSLHTSRNVTLFSFLVSICITTYAQLSWGAECCCRGSVCTNATPLTPVCHCAPVMIDHVLQRLALSWREETNHTPHYPGLVTPMRSSPKTPQPVAVWKEVGRVQMCARGIEKERER